MSRLAEHDFGTSRSATRRMCREVSRPHVGLGLDDASHAKRATIIVHQVHTDEVAGNRKRAGSVEVAREFAGSIHEPAWY